MAEFDGFVAGGGFEDAGDELFVFGRLDATGAIDENAAGFENAKAPAQSSQFSTCKPGMWSKSDWFRVSSMASCARQMAAILRSMVPVRGWMLFKRWKVSAACRRPSGRAESVRN